MHNNVYQKFMDHVIQRIGLRLWGLTFIALTEGRPFSSLLIAFYFNLLTCLSSWCCHAVHSSHRYKIEPFSLGGMLTSVKWEMDKLDCHFQSVYLHPLDNVVLQQKQLKVWSSVSWSFAWPLSCDNILHNDDRVWDGCLVLQQPQL